jgi:hypothetical protein
MILKPSTIKKTMFTRFRCIALLVALLPFTASAVSEEQVIRNVECAPGGKLIVKVDFGSIDIAPGADDKVALEAYRKIDFGDQSKEKQYLADAPVTLSKEGNVVTIQSHRNRTDDWNVFRHQEMNARYTVHVPKKFEVDLHTDGGRINVTDIAGNVKAHTSGGHMAFARIEGVLDAETSGGGIDAEGCVGPARLETSGGHIKVTGGKGSLNAHTSGGAVQVSNFLGDTEVRTSGGSLDLEKIGGKLIGKTSGGSIKASLAPVGLGEVKLSTSAGSIDFAVPANAGLTIDAKTSVGQVISRLPIQTTDTNRERLRGTLNGGGKSVELETSVGNITIKSSAEVAER